MNTRTAQTFDDLEAQITEQQSTLSKRLKQISEYVLDHPNKVALQTVSTIAEEAGVNPSALIRFASAFGFSGFTEMQQLFKQRITDHSISYRDRLRQSYSVADTDENGIPGTQTIIREFVSASIESAEQLIDPKVEECIEAAVDLMLSRKNLYIMGLRRSYAISSYATYALRQIKTRAIHIDCAGAMHMEHTSVFNPKDDLLICVSFSPYATETREVMLAAYNADVPIISISDSMLSPLKPVSNVFFEIVEQEVRGIRSLSASITLIQSLVVAYANKLEASDKHD